MRNNYRLNYFVTRPYSTGSSNLNPGSWRIFKFKVLPYHWHNLVLPGHKAVSFACLRDKLEESLASSCYSKKSKMRLAFGIVNVFPVESFSKRFDQGNPIGFLEGFSIIKSALANMFKLISSFSFSCSSFSLDKKKKNKKMKEESGVEFIFGHEAVNAIAKLIKNALESQGKDPETIHIWISFWTCEDDDVNDDDDDDDDNAPDQLNLVESNLLVNRLNYIIRRLRNINWGCFLLFFFISRRKWKKKKDKIKEFFILIGIILFLAVLYFMELLSRDGDDKEDDNKDSQESSSQVTVYSDFDFSSEEKEEKDKDKDKEKDPVNTLSVSPVSAQSPASSATLEYTEDDTSSFSCSCFLFLF